MMLGAWLETTLVGLLMRGYVSLLARFVTKDYTSHNALT